MRAMSCILVLNRQLENKGTILKNGIENLKLIQINLVVFGGKDLHFLLNKMRLIHLLFSLVSLGKVSLLLRERRSPGLPAERGSTE
uniref:Uncharacterized protein n=1 Tax=Caenorhabditis tropicalis TaxID=1561998 RepID=A0A1I7TBC2_9PELO